MFVTIIFAQIIHSHTAMYTLCILLLVLPFVYLQDDFGTGDYTDNGEVDVSTQFTTPRTVVFQRPRPPFPMMPRGGSGGRGGGGGGTRRITPQPRPQQQNEDRPWLQNRPEEDTTWNRLFDFVGNLLNDFNNVRDGEYVPFLRFQFNRFVDALRYQGYDQHDHFNHCTQRAEGCRYVPVTRRPTTTTTTPTNDTDVFAEDIVKKANTSTTT